MAAALRVPHRRVWGSAGNACGKRRVARSSERVLSAPELEGGHFTARPVPANSTGRQPLSSIVVNNGSSIEHAAHRGARPRLTVLLLAATSGTLF